MHLDVFKKWYQEHRDEIQKDFFAFLRFKSISTDSKYKEDTRNCAKWLQHYLEKMGFEASLWDTTGHPIVFGSYLKAGPNRPTVLVYQHYDVQPVDPLELWHSPPFDPEIRDGNIYARGAVDNKGQCFFSLQALRAFVQMADNIGINIKVFIEGEEESGSKGTAALLAKKEQELKADHLLVVDFDIPEKNVPAVTLGMRGMICMDIEVSNSFADLHSGVHGGIALNPNRALAAVLTKLWDNKGRITVPGFYDDVEEVSKEELSRLYLHFDVKEYQDAFGVKALCAEDGKSLVESNWLRPSLEINGMSGGYTGEGFKTIIPAKAHAKLSCRLVPNQDPEKIAKAIADFLRHNIAKGVDLNIDILQGAPAYRASIDSQIIKTASLAFEEVFGSKCRYLLCGASVPIVYDLAKVSGAEAALIGVGLSSDSIHAPNEHFGLDRFEQGFLTMARIFSLLSK